jgi:hypothetical protein
VLLARLRAAHRATAGDRVRAQAAARGGRVDSPMKSRATGNDVAPERRLVSDASLSFFVEGRILESPRPSRDLNVHGRQSKPRIHFNANMAIMRRQSMFASQRNLNEAQYVAYLCSLRKQTFQMHGSFRCPLLADCVDKVRSFARQKPTLE